MRRGPKEGIWIATGIAAAGLVALPIVAVVGQFLAPDAAVWSHLMATTLPEIIANTAGLLLGVALGCIVIGVATAWIVTMYEFPGRRLFEWALVLPLAMPAYIIGYAYSDFLTFAGPVQSSLRTVFEWRRGDYWFPDIHGIGGVIGLLTLVLYPYVYLLARAAFLEQSVCVLEASRTLGCNNLIALRRVALPLARPAIAAGTGLALMETLAEFGLVQYFGVQTFTTAIYNTWFGLGNRPAAAQLASLLVVFVLVLVILERSLRGGQRYHHTTNRYRPIPRQRLGGAEAIAAVLVCASPILLGFLVPTARLFYLSISAGDPLWGPLFLEFALNSVTLAALAAVITVAIALLMAYGQRLSTHPVVALSMRFGTMGYAIPGTVIAVGILVPLGALDNALDRLARDTIGVSTGLLLSSSIVALLFGYVVRFVAVAHGAVESGLAKIAPNMDAAARTLGATPGGALRRLHVPLLAGSTLTGALIVFVDTMKELPATVLIRPFGFDTLAVRVYSLAKDERLAEASTGALVIVLTGLLPVLVLSSIIRRQRPGERASAL
ncbi:MAG: iron ABC transporter permease [Alphaproteobacteria bacterium]|nr:iron ABC transporter permease [Alphaproteobacteria bacterium]